MKKIYLVIAEVCFDYEEKQEMAAYENEEEANEKALAAWTELCKNNDNFNGWEVDADEEHNYYEALGEEGFYIRDHVSVYVKCLDLHEKGKINYEELANNLLDRICEIDDPREAIETLIGFGYTKEQLLELMFVEDDIDAALEESEEE